MPSITYSSVAASGIECERGVKSAGFVTMLARFNCDSAEEIYGLPDWLLSLIARLLGVKFTL